MKKYLGLIVLFILSSDFAYAASKPISLSASSNDTVVSPTPCVGGACTIGSTQIINAQGTAASYTILSTDMGKTVSHNKTTAVAVTLPQAGTTGFAAGVSYEEANFGAGPVTITPTTSTINGLTTLTLLKSQSAYIISDGTNWFAMVGSLPIPPCQTLTISAAAIATNIATGYCFNATLTHLASTAISNPTGTALDGQFLLYILTQDSTGSNAITWGNAFDTNNNPTLSTAANKVDYVGVRWNAALSLWVFQGSSLGN